MSSVAEPVQNVTEDEVGVLGRLSEDEAVPHARIALERFVAAARSLIQGPADLDVSHHVFFAMQYQERKLDLHKHKDLSGEPAIHRGTITRLTKCWKSQN
jgi:hypothetical protein